MQTNATVLSKFYPVILVSIEHCSSQHPQARHSHTHAHHPRHHAHAQRSHGKIVHSCIQPSAYSHLFLLLGAKSTGRPRLQLDSSPLPKRRPKPQPTRTTQSGTKAEDKGTQKSHSPPRRRFLCLARLQCGVNMSISASSPSQTPVSSSSSSS